MENGCRIQSLEPNKGLEDIQAKIFSEASGIRERAAIIGLAELRPEIVDFKTIMVKRE